MVASPERKRIRLDPTVLSASPALDPFSWSVQDKLPLSYRRKGAWNRALQIAGPSQWLLKCQEWADNLFKSHFRKTFNVREILFSLECQFTVRALGFEL